MKGIKFFVLVVFVFSILFQPLYATIYGSISGKVTDRDSEVGIPNVKVELFKPYKVKNPDNKETITDNIGRYSFKNVKPGRYAMRFSPPHPFCYKFYGEYYKKDIIIKEGEDVVINKSFVIGGSLRGVVYKGKKGIPFWNVSVRLHSFKASEAFTKTKKDGSYFIGSLCPSQDYCIEVSHKISGYSYKFMTGIKIEKVKCTQVKDIVFNFEDITGVEGYVKSSLDGKPLADVRVSFGFSKSTFRGGRILNCGCVDTDSNGYFCMKGLEPSEYSVYILPQMPPKKHPKTGKPYYTSDEFAELIIRRRVNVKKDIMTNIFIEIENPSYYTSTKKNEKKH